jgi:TolB-like protein/DNA-binding winged helix-turn-helix (wHTH) protein/Tfp pilus assembly protein PilF
LGEDLGAEPLKIQAVVRLEEDIELDLHSGQLRHSGQIVKLERIPSVILTFLVEQSPKIVSREQIVERVWGKAVAFDSNNSINGAIRKIRKALRDDPERPRFIQTISGTGYRFIGKIPAPPIEHLALVPEPAPVEVPPPPKTKLLPYRLLIGTCLAATVVLGAYFVRSRAKAKPQPAASRTMLAVLPFANLTGIADQDYFSDGMTEEMITQVGRLDPQRLGVIARTSVAGYKSNPKSLDQVRAELGVQYVLEGSVRLGTDKVRVTAQLIQVKDQAHLWARAYDRDLKDVLTMQSEIAREIADEIELTLSDQKRLGAAHSAALSPKSLEAYEFYLRGRYFLNKRTPQGFQQAVDYFQRAIAKDPAYARSYAGLADSFALMSSYSIAPPKELIPKARAAALRALALDESEAEAHASLALIAQNYDWDWQTAGKEFRRAIQLDPNYATAHHWYAEHLGLQGQFDSAFAEMERARQLDPLSLIIATDYGALLYFSHQYDRAIRQLLGVLEMEPNFPRAHIVIFAYVQRGRFAEALADIENWRRFDDAAWGRAMRVYIYTQMGESAKARQALQEVQQPSTGTPADPFLLFVAYLGTNDREKALFWLDKACAEHSPALTALKVDPLYDTLRADPRFQSQLARLGLQ